MDILRLVLCMGFGLAFLRVLLSFKSLMYLLGRCWRWLEERTQAYQCFEIPRYGGDDAQASGIHENPLYRKALAYMSALPSLEDCDGARVFSSGRKPNEFSLQPGPGAPVQDYFLGAKLHWAHLPSRLLLRLRRQDARRVLRPYLQHVESVAEEMDLRRRELRLFVHTGPAAKPKPFWQPVPLVHPATLDTVAIDPDVKAKVRADLESFLKGRANYHRAGRAWRRSYLLHGPPGTGKSSFAAAMAKFLCYDLYELSLAQLDSDADLRSLLLQTTPRSVILVEHLDRYLLAGNGEDEEKERRLTEMLELTDGVSASSSEERVMVFTMGSKDGVDPAILRPGRVDVHIGFPMCDFPAFKALANSYLGLKDHKLYPQVEEGFQGGARLSPAEVGEIMLANRGSPSRALKSVITALQQSTSSAFSSLRRRPSESLSLSGSLGGDELGCGEGHGLRFGRDATIREFKKLYGLIRRNPSRKEGVMPLEVAAAAAAAAAAPEMAMERRNAEAGKQSS